MKQRIQGTVLIVGARSDIGQALARAYAAQGANVILAARDAASLEPARGDLALRYGVTVNLVDYDLLGETPEKLATDLALLPDTVILVAGLLGDQDQSAAQPNVADDVMRTNFAAPARLLLAFAGTMRTRGTGTIIGISSVAGDRGRGSNYIYGASKAGLTAFLSGLRNSLIGTGVHVMTVKPGFVRTRMTEGMSLPRRLTAEPNEVAQAIVKAHIARKDVIYVRPIWRIIMTVIRVLPEPLFKRMKL